MISKEQIAHDLAIAYIHNRYGADVSGTFSVSTSSGDVSGGGEVSTKRLPHVDRIRTVRVGTGERGFFGLVEKTVRVQDGYEVDSTFAEMITDYNLAFSRFLSLLRSQ